jgi:hypothetical protein
MGPKEEPDRTGRLTVGRKLNHHHHAVNTAPSMLVVFDHIISQSILSKHESTTESSVTRAVWSGVIEIPECSRREGRNPRTSDRIIGIAAETRTRHL